MHALQTLYTAFLAACITATAGRAEPEWSITPDHGPHPVGFRSGWILDHARTYTTAAADGTIIYGPASRPVLINTWYPAAHPSFGEPMTRRDYLDIQSTIPAIAPLAEALSEYAETIITEQVAGAAYNDLDNERRSLLDDLLDSPVPARRDAAAAGGQFPLLIYHAGFGSSFEDNAAMCEYLASNGFVVAGSAFLQGDGESFNVDARHASARDVEAIIRHLTRLPEVDPTRIAMIGHSGGAHAALRCAAEPNSALDVIVSLDTTQDYYCLEHPLWRSLVDDLLARRESLTADILFAAEPYAIFTLAEQLEFADRTCMTVPHLDHNSFIAQGVYAAIINPPDDGDPPTTQDVIDSYRRLCTGIWRYLDARLNVNEESAALMTLLHEPFLLNSWLHAEVMPPGPPPASAFDPESGDDPLPRDIRPILRTHGPDAAVRMLERTLRITDDHPVGHRIFAVSLLHELHIRGEDTAFESLWAFYRTRHPDLADSFIAQAELWIRLGTAQSRLDYARTCLDIAARLSPEHPHLNELRNALDNR